MYELYYLDLATGLRRGELLGLKWTDVDLDRGILKIQRVISRQNGKVVEAPLKTKNAYRTLPLSADAIDVLKMQKCKIGNSEWVFPSSTSPPTPSSRRRKQWAISYPVRYRPFRYPLPLGSAFGSGKKQDPKSGTCEKQKSSESDDFEDFWYAMRDSNSRHSGP